MKSYKFKMDKVLEYRENVEKVKVEDFAKITHKLRTEEEHLKDLLETLEEKKKVKQQDLYGMKMGFLYREKLKAEVDRQVSKVKEISVKAEAAQHVLIEARKDRKIMEMLKEKDQEKYRLDLLNTEQKELDDLSVMRFIK